MASTIDSKKNKAEIMLNFPSPSIEVLIICIYMDSVKKMCICIRSEEN